MQRLALAAVAIGAISAATVSPAEARWGGGWHGGWGGPRYRIRPRSWRFGLWSRRCCIAVLLRTWLWILRAAILPTRTLCLLWRTSLLRPSVLSLGSAC